MVLTEKTIRMLIRNALNEAISDRGQIGKGLGAEYLYALLQPAIIDTGNLDLQKITLPPHQQREELVVDDEETQLKDKGSEIDKPVPDVDVITTRIPKQYKTPEEDLKIKF